MSWTSITEILDPSQRVVAIRWRTGVALLALIVCATTPARADETAKSSTSPPVESVPLAWQVTESLTLTGEVGFRIEYMANERRVLAFT